ncbi:cupin domain-containing protein [Gimesia fumaroli]|uniref:Cupin domain protein n=1 Tax=Gimesia fumaroli TaxID=2527976 RepID=A0A518I6K4_9PLAN|nr:cupin domain-containing protein [Gimesia fumaroli]QDV48737.1 Cupin domain protein [Gimesia fumaroli]
MVPEISNLFTPQKTLPVAELFEELFRGQTFRVERIVSTGQATREGQWYDQQHAEWVVLLTGSAVLRFEGETEGRPLVPGDAVNIPAHCRHRVEATADDRESVWLAIHYEPVENGETA